MKQMKVDHKISTVGEDDFPELEGKIIMFQPAGNQAAIPCVVVGCNRSIGVTLVNANNKDDYILCYIGPIIPEKPDGKYFNAETHEKVFNVIVEGIIDGELWSEDLADAMTSMGVKSSAGAGPQACAWNQ